MRPVDDEVVRAAVYDHFIACGSAPTLTDLAAQLGQEAAALAASYRRLAAARALVLDAAGAIVMAIPFAAEPTDVRVRSAGGSWWANCAFDGLGIPVLLGRAGTVETSCPHTGAPITVEVGTVSDESDPCVLHMAVPLAAWWEHIGET